MSLVWQRYLFQISAAGLITLSVVAGSIPMIIQVSVLAILVALFGIPHGALDPLVAYDMPRWKSKIGMVGFLLFYVILAVLVILIWHSLPGISLLIFLLISGIHFSGDWRGALPFLYRLPLGLLIVTGPALFHRTEVESLFSMLSTPAAGVAITQWMSYLGVLVIPACLLPLLKISRKGFLDMLEIALLLLSVILLTPLLFFVLYFCGLHSPRHFCSTLKEHQKTLAWLVCVLITGVTLLGAVTFYFYLPSISLSQSLIQITFIGLAALTVPHMLLIEYASASKVSETAVYS